MSSSEDKFNPYQDNGGTTICLTGKDFVIIGGDTRLSDESYQILSRNVEKVYKIKNNIYIAMAGCKTDADVLVEVLRQEVADYEYKTKKDISPTSFSRIVHVQLYQKRFFPWYTFNIVAGIENGEGKCFAYDAIGSSGSYKYAAGGSGESTVITVLDNEIMPKITNDTFKDMTVEQAEEIVCKAMLACSEREIKTGDDFIYYIIKENGVQQKVYRLRRD